MSERRTIDLDIWMKMEDGHWEMVTNGYDMISDACAEAEERLQKHFWEDDKPIFGVAILPHGVHPSTEVV